MRDLVVIDRRPQTRIVGREPEPVVPEPRRPRVERHGCNSCRHHDCVCNWWRYYWDAYWEASPWGSVGIVITIILSLAIVGVVGIAAVWTLLDVIEGGIL